VLVPRVEGDVVVVSPPDEASRALVDRVFQKICTSSSGAKQQTQLEEEKLDAVGNKARAVEFFAKHRISVADEGDRLVLEGGVATLENPFASPVDCKSTNAVVLGRIRRLLSEIM
jgi:hypothetical protein